jgi:hypothetical protein
VSVGAFLLAWVLWSEDTQPDLVAVPASSAVNTDSRELS